MPLWFIAVATTIEYAIASACAFIGGGLIAVGIHRLLTRRNGQDQSKPTIDSQGAWMFAIIIAIPCGVGILTLLLAILGGPPGK